MNACYAPTPQTTSRRFKTTQIAGLIGVAFALLPSRLHAHDVTPPAAPTTIQVPAGNKPFLRAHAVGTQNYLCVSSPTPTGPIFFWSFFGPEATLFDDDDMQIITHFLSPNPDELDTPGGTPRPTWQSSRDSSKVWGGQVVSSSDAAFVAPGAIPWLRLQVVGADFGPTWGQKLTETTYLQRVHTSGGVAPTTGCSQVSDVTKKALVPYEADYYFYKSAKRK